MKYSICVLLLMMLACSSKDKAIKIKGSDTEVNLAVNLAENFYKTNPDFSVAISGGGSGLGIASLLNRQTDIANSSRPLTEEEDSLFKAKKINIHKVVFAEDATAFIVQKDFPADSIEVAVLAKVLSGEYATWKPVTGKDISVNIYGRQSNSGTHSFVRKKLKIEFSKEAKEMNGNAQIMEGIKTDASGIGYVGAGYISHNGNNELKVKVLKIIERTGEPAVSPLDEKAIHEHRYYFQRPLYQFIAASSWNKVSAFIDFEKGPVGQALIQASGYYYAQ